MICLVHFVNFFLYHYVKYKSCGNLVYNFDHYLYFKGFNRMPNLHPLYSCAIAMVSGGHRSLKMKQLLPTHCQLKYTLNRNYVGRIHDPDSVSGSCFGSKILIRIPDFLWIRRNPDLQPCSLLMRTFSPRQLSKRHNIIITDYYPVNYLLFEQ